VKFTRNGPFNLVPFGLVTIVYITRHKIIDIVLVGP
jgi:hypothetical protein